MLNKLANIKYVKHKEETKKVVFCVRDFMLILNNLADYELKYYWVSGLTDFFYKAVNGGDDKRLKNIYEKYKLNKIIPKYDIKVKDFLKYPTFKSKQALLLYYHLDKVFFPLIEKYRKKVAAECIEQVRNSIKKIRICVSSTNLPTFNYSASVVQMFCDDLKLSNHERAVYYAYIIEQIYGDIEAGIIAKDINNVTLKTNLEIFKRELDYLTTLNSLREPIRYNDNNFDDNDEFINGSTMNHQTNNPRPNEPIYYHILNKNRIKLNCSLEQCRLFIIRLQEYKYLEDMREIDPECKFYLSLFVDKDNVPFSNAKEQMVRFNGDNNELAYLIKHFTFGKEPLITDRRCWKRTEGVFLDKYGNKFKDGSLKSTAYNNSMPENHKNLDKIISDVKNLKQVL